MVDAINRPTPPKRPAAATAQGTPAAPAQAAAPARQAGDRQAVSPEARARAPKDPYEALLKLKQQDDGAEAKGKDDGSPVGLTAFSHVSTSWAGKRAQAAATKGLEENRGAEQTQLASLGERASEYNRVRDQIKGDPSAERALQTMLLDGRLAGAKDLNGEKDLLGHLDAIATQQNAKGVKAPELLRTLTRELENPEGISQGDGSIGTCVATSVTIAAAKDNPAEVARLVAGLAKDSPGEVAMHPAPGETQGPTLKRPENWNVATTSKDGKEGMRTPAVRLLQGGKHHYSEAQLRQAVDEANLPR